MPTPERRAARRRAAGPRVEALEGRQLLSLSGLLWQQAARSQARVAGLLRAPEVAPPGDPEPARTPHRRDRREFVAMFSGSPLAGPGRSADAARQLYLSGGGTSTAFLKGAVQLAVELPADPAEEVRGAAALYPQNYVATGSLLILDLRADPPAEPGTFPTLYTWEVNDNSGGVFTHAEGSGTLELQLGRRGGRGPAGGATFRGRVETVGIFDPRRVDIGGP